MLKIGLGLLTLVVMGLGMAGCTAKPSNDAAAGQSVVGPDLDRNGPFMAAHDIILEEPGPADAAASATDDNHMHIEIVRNGNEDVATLQHVVSDTKSYLAGVTYHPFLPILAETNAARKDYWIIGLNLTRTPDRSIYTVVRYPHGLKITPGLTSNTFEYLTLTCDNLELVRQKSYSADGQDKNGKPTHRDIPLAPALPPQAGECEYNNLTEALAVTPVILGDYDRIKHEKDAPTLEWKPLHVTVK